MSDERWNFGASRSQRDARSEHIIIQRFEQAVTFATFSRGGGGVGKTTLATVVAQTLDASAPDAKTLLVDKHPIGSIEEVTGVRREDIACVQQGHPEEACFTLIEAFRNMEKLTSEASIRWRFPVMDGTGMFVLTYPEEERLEPEELKTFVKKMKQLFSFVVFDCDPDDGQADTKALLEVVDAVGVITKRRNKNRTVQAASAVSTLRDNTASGRKHDRVVLVVNQVWFNIFHWWGTTRTVQMLNEVLGEKYEGSVATLPSNFLISTGKQFLVRQRSPHFKHHALETTALLVERAHATVENQESAVSVHQAERRASGIVL